MVRIQSRRLIALGAVVVILASCASTPPAPPPTAPTGSASSGPSAPTIGSAGSSPGVPATPYVQPVAWTDCGGGFQCGTVAVPRDYDHPAAASLSLSLIRLAASDPSKRIGSLVLDPGGPGASGTDFVREGANVLFSKSIRSRFDIVGFDPRGVNRSAEIRCVDNMDHFLAIDSSPDTAAELKQLLDGERSFVNGCQRNAGDVLPFVGTQNVVRDLDTIRAAIGDAKLTYIGFSYGTFIGALYAQTYPDRIRALVLDGALDPKLDLAHLREGQAVAFEASLKRFLTYCAHTVSCAFHHGGKPGPAFDALMRRIEVKPLSAKTVGSVRKVGPTYTAEAVLGAMYSRAEWPLLGYALAYAEQGDGSLLLLLSDPLSGRNTDGTYSNLVDANTAVMCLDFPAPRDPKPYTAEAKRLARLSPHFGVVFAYNDVGCAFWPVGPDRKPGPVSAPTAPPIVIIGSTGDPATPYQWAVNLSHQLSSSILVTRVGDGHTGYGVSACVRKATDAYLTDLTLPKKGLRCQS